MVKKLAGYFLIILGFAGMVSQSFPFGKDVMEKNIEKELVILYVSPFDKNDYLFDLQM